MLNVDKGINMLTWLLGINLKQVEMIIGAGFIVVIALLTYIAFEVKEIEKDEHK